MLTIIIELLVFAALVIELIIVYRKAKQLQRSVIECKSKVDEQSEQIAEKDAEIEKLNTMLSEPQFTHLDAEVHGKGIYLVCWNRYTEKEFIHTFGLVTDERLRKELLTKIRKLINHEYYKTTDVQS